MAVHAKVFAFAFDTLGTADKELELELVATDMELVGVDVAATTTEEPEVTEDEEGLEFGTFSPSIDVKGWAQR